MCAELNLLQICHAQRPVHQQSDGAI